MITLYFNSSILIASGGFDNGTATQKGEIGLDLTWNPFNYLPKGQSYIVLSYGISNQLNIHGYYSTPAKGNDNYYIGTFYQFINYKYLDLATAVGLRKYNPKYETHIFFPQILYTIKINQKFYIGGSFVTIRKLEEFISIGTAKDIAAIIPIYRSKDNSKNVNSINFAIGMFRPILWKPDKSSWHPTYSIDLNLKLHSR